MFIGLISAKHRRKSWRIGATFQKYKIKITGMIPSIQCYAPPSVELLRLTTPAFKPGPTTTQFFKPDWRRWRERSLV